MYLSISGLGILVKAVVVVKVLKVFSHIPWLKKQKSLAISIQPITKPETPWTNNRQAELSAYSKRSVALNQRLNFFSESICDGCIGDNFFLKIV